MNIFEDLIEELKEENLLEETVTEFRKENAPTGDVRAEKNNSPVKKVKNAAEFEQSPLFFSAETAVDEEIYAAVEMDAPDAPIFLENADLFELSDDSELFTEDTRKPYQIVESPKGFVNEKEYFRKRAMDEVTGLQMVDNVLSGVEREQMKLVPKPYDDLPVKLTLHDFLQNPHDVNSTEHAQAEFKLMQETENWCSALSHRDHHISIAHLRRHCESTRPPLSPQALIALARFYRNSPYTEAVRSKFELVITRLFSRENEHGERELLLTREEIIQQLKELYADWSSIQLYSDDEADSEIVVSMMKFEDFISEALETHNFDELIGSDFFNRLRMFKQDCNENFFAPPVVAATVIANVKIGNRYIELLDKEKEKFNSETLEEKYGFLHDQAISDATGKTFQLVELLQERGEQREAAEIVEVAVKEEKRSYVRAPKKPRSKLFAINKWLLGATILTIVVCFGLYFWAENEAAELKPPPSVKKVNLDNSEFKDYIQTARITDETLIGVTTNAWESMNGEKKEQMLQKLLSIGGEKNYKKVQLVNSKGRSVGYASPDKTEVYNQ